DPNRIPYRDRLHAKSIAVAGTVDECPALLPLVFERLKGVVAGVPDGERNGLLQRHVETAQRESLDPTCIVDFERMLHCLPRSLATGDYRQNCQQKHSTAEHDLHPCLASA